MHMADALASPAVAGTMYVLSSAAAGYSIRQVQREQNEKKIPVMGVMGAFVFAAQMINFAIPGTGASGHLCGSVLLSAVLGPCAGFLTMTVILTVQCLLFADGGLLALGCNIWNMAFYGCFAGGLLLWRMWMKHGVSKKKIAAASLVSCILTLQLGAFSVTLETLASGITELPFAVFVSVMQPIHLAIGAVEGLITAAILVFLYEARPELVWTGAKREGAEEQQAREDTEGGAEEQQARGRLSWKKTLAVLAVLSVVTAGGVSLLASSHPDGLEWSIAQITGDTELSATAATRAQEAAAGVQEKTAVLPDYSFKQGESAAGTTVSGLLGGLAAMLLCVAACFLFRCFRYGGAGKEDGRERQRNEQT